ncbi:melanocortin receptor 5-like [Saccostrea cucullata]|uniref:melanocortin receptor 5-like n=1 Tax=Saccostrea cuccullata TaxID=36930 RepID=UPI002ED172C6
MRSLRLNGFMKSIGNFLKYLLRQGLKALVSGQQGIPSPSLHLVPPVLFPKFFMSSLQKMDRNTTVESLFPLSKNYNISDLELEDNVTYNTSRNNDFPTEFLVTLVVATLILITGVIGNSFTIMLVIVKRNLHTPTYTAIACLGIADLLASCSRFVLHLNQYFDFLNSMEITVYGIITLFFLHAANFHVVLFAYLRCKLISSPLHSIGITCRKVLKISIVIWIAGGVVTSAYGTIMILEIKSIVSLEDSLLTEIIFWSYTYFLPLFLIVYFHVRKIRTMKQHKSETTRTPRYTHMSKSMSFMFIIIIAIFVISTTPSYVHVIIQYICWKENYHSITGICMHYPFSLSYSISYICVMLNNCINPIIYFMFSPPVRKFLNRCLSIQR